MDIKDLRGLLEAYSEVYAPGEIEEAVKGESSETRRDMAAERRRGIKPLPAKEGERYAKWKMDQIAYAKRRKMGEEIEEVGEEMKPLPKNKMFRKAGNLGRDIVSPATGDEDRQKKYDRQKKIIRTLNKANEEFDIFDVVLEFLYVEGYVDTLEEAEWMMANLIDEEAVAIILGEEQLDELSVNKMLAYGKAAQKDRDVLNKKWDEKKASHKEKMRVLGHEEGEDRAAEKIKKKTGKYPHQMNALDKARYAVTKEEFAIDEAITSEKGKAKAAEMIAKRTTASGRAKPGQGDNVATIRHISRSNRDGLLGTPPNRKVAGSNWPKSYSGLGGTGNKAARRAAELNKEAFESWLDEAMSNYEKNRKRAAQRAAARNAARDQGKTGVVPGVGYVTPRRERETWTDESGKTRHAKGL